MTRPKTKPINYEGCNPTIEEHLKAGVAVWCEVWNGNRKSSGCRWVIGFKAGFAHKYITEGMHEYCHAKPIIAKLRVKKTSEIVAMLEEEGVPLSQTYYSGDGPIQIAYNIFSIDKCAGKFYKSLSVNERAFIKDEWLEEVEG